MGGTFASMILKGQIFVRSPERTWKIKALEDSSDVGSAKKCSRFITDATEAINIVARFVELRRAARFVVRHELDTKRVWKDAWTIATVCGRFVTEDAMPNLM